MVLERRPAALVPSARFRVARRRYDLQYAQLYYQRLASLRPAVLAEAERRWGTAARHVGKVLDVTVGERCVVIGTVYMDMPLKPNILDEVTSEVRLLSAALARRAPRVAGPSRHRCRRCPPSRWSRAPGQRYTVQAPRRPKYVSDKDQAILEDESGRISLAGDHIRQAVICTGVVCVVPAVPRRFHTLTAAAEAPPAPGCLPTCQAWSWPSWASNRSVASFWCTTLPLRAYRPRRRSRSPPGRLNSWPFCLAYSSATAACRRTCRRSWWSTGSVGSSAAPRWVGMRHPHPTSAKHAPGAHPCGSRWWWWCGGGQGR